MDKLDTTVKEKYSNVFSAIPHIDDLPTDVYCRIQLKDATKTITTRSYSTPRKYKEAWAELIQQHLDAGRIRLKAHGVYVCRGHTEQWSWVALEVTRKKRDKCGIEKWEYKKGYILGKRVLVVVRG